MAKERRLTKEEIIRRFPVAEMYNEETVVERYYGDVPSQPQLKLYLSDDPIISNIVAVDNYMIRQYHPDKLYKYSFCNGDGIMRNHDGEDIIVTGNVDIRYGNGESYRLTLFNKHGKGNDWYDYEGNKIEKKNGIHGFVIWRGDSCKPTISAYATSDDMWNTLLPTKCVREVISMDTIEKLFTVVENTCTYGYFARKLVQCAREILQESEE